MAPSGPEGGHSLPPGPVRAPGASACPKPQPRICENRLDGAVHGIDERSLNTVVVPEILFMTLRRLNFLGRTIDSRIATGYGPYCSI
jgi:hypothetical protein